MSKYKRRHGVSNTSKGIYWILLAGIIAVLVYKVIEFRRKIKEVEQDIEKENEYKESKMRDTSSILVDSSVLLQRQ
ncbi:MAG TPA: hypothetical protein VMZ03_04660 [Chitinophagaceae bacterium]|nr:hypothetical protein [Chitinophagaceae bacterium]